MTNKMEEGRDSRKKTFSIAIHSPGAERLRKTIQAKLADFLGSDTDDVLAEYVVVLVGHGKQYLQTVADLEAFLGDQTQSFCDWLWDHLTANKHLYVTNAAPEEQHQYVDMVTATAGALEVTDTVQDQQADLGRDEHDVAEPQTVGTSGGQPLPSEGKVVDERGQEKEGWHETRTEREAYHGGSGGETEGRRGRVQARERGEQPFRKEREERHRAGESYDRYHRRDQDRRDLQVDSRHGRGEDHRNGGSGPQSFRRGDADRYSRLHRDSQRRSEREAWRTGDRELQSADARHHGRRLHSRLEMDVDEQLVDLESQGRRFPSRMDRGVDDELVDLKQQGRKLPSRVEKGGNEDLEIMGQGGQKRASVLDKGAFAEAVAEPKRPLDEQEERRNGANRFYRAPHGRDWDGRGGPTDMLDPRMDRITGDGRSSLANRKLGGDSVGQDEKLKFEERGKPEQRGIRHKVMQEDTHMEVEQDSMLLEPSHGANEERLEQAESLRIEIANNIAQTRESRGSRKNGRTKPKRSRPDDWTSAVTDHDDRHTDEPPQKFIPQIRMRMNPSARLLQTAVREAVMPSAGSSQGMPPAKRLCSVVAASKVPEHIDSVAEPGLGSIERGRAEATPASVWQRLGRDAIPDKQRGHAAIGEETRSLQRRRKPAGHDMRVNHREWEVAGPAPFGGRRSRVEGGNGYATHVIHIEGASNSTLKLNINGSREEILLTRNRRSETVYDTQHSSDDNDWGERTGGGNHGRNDVGFSSQGASEAWESEEGFGLELPPAPSGLGRRLGARSNSGASNSKAAADQDPGQRGAPGVTFSKAENSGTGYGVGRGSSSWHRLPLGEAMGEEPATAQRSSLRVVLEEAETEEDEPMEEQSRHQEDKNAGETENVEEMKRRMRQVQLEMTKLRARQAEVAKDLKKAIPAPTAVKAATKEEIDARSIFVSNVHFAATVASLTAHFSGCGDVVRVTLLTDAATGIPRGCAYIEFASEDSIEKALAMNESSFLSRLLKVVRKPAAKLEALASVPGRGGPIRRPSPPVRGSPRPSFSRGTPHPPSGLRGSPAAPRLQWRRGGNSSVSGDGDVTAPQLTVGGSPSAAGIGKGQGPDGVSPTASAAGYSLSWTAGGRGASALSKPLHRGPSLGRSLSYRRSPSVTTTTTTNTSPVAAADGAQKLGATPNTGSQAG